MHTLLRLLSQWRRELLALYGTSWMAFFLFLSRALRSVHSTHDQRIKKKIIFFHREKKLNSSEAVPALNVLARTTGTWMRVEMVCIIFGTGAKHIGTSMKLNTKSILNVNAFLDFFDFAARLSHAHIYFPRDVLSLTGISNLCFRWRQTLTASRADFRGKRLRTAKKGLKGNLIESSPRRQQGKSFFNASEIIS